VVRALRDRGAEPVVFDTAAFPGGTPLTLTYEQARFRGGSPGAETIAAPSDARDLRDATDAAHGCSAVWQSLVVGTDLPAMAPGVRETCVQASELAVVGWLESLEVFQLDPYGRKLRADNKPYQLRVAQRVGLELPATIISNDPDAVRAFARRHGAVITKMLVQPASPGPEADESAVVFTTALTEADLAQLEGLELCPMIFQAQVENQLDVRVTLVGNRVFGAALDADARGGGDPDWRRQSYAMDRVPTWAPYQVPSAISAPLIRLLDHFGLNYGAADLIVRPDGRHVFLELNASGAFVFLGDAMAAEIAAAIADVLVDPAARRVPGPAASPAARHA
jgi:glutathione synthase/RimK-type ligase-like ATP-grasp enzyme